MLTCLSAQAQPSPTAELERLRSLSAQQGTVRVIIGVGASHLGVPERHGVLSAQRRSTMQAAQNQVLGTVLAQGSAKVHAVFDTVPHIAAEVDANTLERLHASPWVSSIQEDVAVPPTLLQSTGQIHANTVWDGGRTGTDWVVAVLDTGVDKSHPFLAGKIVSEACYSSTTSQSSSVCPGGVSASTSLGSGVNCNTGITGCTHGTHVAGIVAGSNAPDGSHGVAKGAQIIAIQVFSHFPAQGAVMSWTSDQIKALERVYALKDSYKIAAVNMSLGGGQYTSACDATQSAMKAAIDNLRAAGIATVIASGNDGYRNAMAAPACISSAISVGSHCDAGPDGSVCATGTGGVASYSNIASFVALLAPGSYINSSMPHGSYATQHGTSMAAPHVAGAWALLKQAQPTVSVTEGLSQLWHHGVDVNDTRSAGVVSGLKRIDLTFLAGQAYTLSVSKSGTGSGAVNSAPSGIQCGTDCTQAYAEGINVTLNPSPSTGSSFAGWTGACSGTGACTVSMTEARTVGAVFNLTPYALTVSKTGAGSGTVQSAPAGIDCGHTCSALMNRNTSVTLTAMAGTGSVFVGWSGACVGTAATCTVSMSAARTVTATFNVQTLSLRVLKAGTGGGTVVSSPAGLSCGSTCSLTRSYGSVVTLSAAPVSGSVFEGWSGAGCSGTGACTVTLTSAAEVSARFSRTHHALSITRMGTGVGTVTADAGGINCGATCTASLAASSTVTLTALPAAGSVFTGWGGACSGSSTCSVSMDMAKAVSASFTRITYALSVSREGTGMGTISSTPAGLSCGSTCVKIFNSGALVTLSARADAGSVFAGWGGACSGTSSTCTVTLSEAKTVTASFMVTHHRLTLTRAGTGSGGVTSLPSGINCGSTCANWVTVGASMALTATPASESAFAGWGGACHGTEATCTVTMGSAQNVTANFTRTHYTLSMALTGPGAVVSTDPAIDCQAASCRSSLPLNTVVTLTPVPSSGARFVAWSGACTGSSSACTTTLSAARSVSAHFAWLSYPLTVSKTGSGSGWVNSNPTGLSCGSSCTVSRTHGSSLVLTATPAAGSVFTGWGGACSGSSTSCTVTATQATSVTAEFALTHVPLSVRRLGTGSGTVSMVNPVLSCTANCSTWVPVHATVVLQATASPESVFSAWSGACSGTDVCALPMSATQTVSATFTRTHYTLSLSRGGLGEGRITASGTEIDCAAVSCAHSLPMHTVVTLTPVASEGSYFTGWSGACVGSGACSVTLSAARSVKANFARTVYAVSVSKSGTGLGTIASSPTGISCGSVCSKTFNSGSTITLTPSAATGSTFTGWTGACTGTAPCVLSLTQARSTTATFSRP